MEKKKPVKKRRTSLEKFLEKVITLLKKADENEEPYVNTAAKLVTMVEHEMLTLQEKLRNSITLMYDDNTDEAITLYIMRHYHINPKDHEKATVEKHRPGQ